MTPRIVPLLLMILVVGCHSAQTSQTGSPGDKPGVKLQVSFKLDPQLAGGTYGGERWVSPPIYGSAAQVGPEVTVEARAEAVDGAGRPVRINPQWTAADPGLVAIAPVTPGQSSQVRITVKHAGQSKLKITWQETSRELLVRGKSLSQGAMQVEVVQ